MMSGVLMVQGTTSDAGKSTLVAGLCRIFHRRDMKVAPFKPQNMALNSAVTLDGGEIGRAQALQAQACQLDAHTDMNPVLIKPESDTGAQIIIQGKVKQPMDAVGFHHYKTVAMTAVLESFTRLKTQFSTVVVEGAGSPAEINLREGDIANMGFAEAVDCPVIIVADIDKGGVFAHLVGTLDLLSDSEQARVVGFVINKFRGDLALLKPGLDWLEARTQRPVLGVLPYIHDLHLDAEDAIDTRQHLAKNSSERVKVIVPVVPRISNHTDFDALRSHPAFDVQFVKITEPMPACDLLILPGSKNVREDLQALKRHGWDGYICRHLRYHGHVMGICGGYQMLGEIISDPIGVEGEPGEIAGLNLLPIKTELAQNKQLKRKVGTLTLGNQCFPVKGYEIHLGVTTYTGGGLLSPLQLSDEGSDIELSPESEGCLSQDGRILGTYLHGFFDSAHAQTAMLHWLGLGTQGEGLHAKAKDWHTIREEQLDRLADTIEAHMDMPQLMTLIS